jgi:two-component system, NarL family, response regulator YdfI
MIRVLLVASSRNSQAGLGNLLSAGRSLQVVRVLSDFATLSASVEELQPDVVLAEIAGIEKILPEEILQLSEEAPVGIILLVDDPNPERDLDALRSGIRAVLPRNTMQNAILAAVEAVGAGLSVLRPEGLDRLLRETIAAQRKVSAPLVEPLTPRELEVLGMMVEGWGNKEISARLGISEHTVKFHVASIMGKLNAESRTEAVTAGIRHGLIML